MPRIVKNLYDTVRRLSPAPIVVSLVECSESLYDDLYLKLDKRDPEKKSETLWGDGPEKEDMKVCDWLYKEMAKRDNLIQVLTTMLSNYLKVAFIAAFLLWVGPMFIAAGKIAGFIRLQRCAKITYPANDNEASYILSVTKDHAVLTDSPICTAPKRLVRLDKEQLQIIPGASKSFTYYVVEVLKAIFIGYEKK
jgi:hypothetical protein